MAEIFISVVLTSLVSRLFARTNIIGLTAWTLPDPIFRTLFHESHTLPAIYL